MLGRPPTREVVVQIGGRGAALVAADVTALHGIEAHGTGTALGDRTEAGGLERALGATLDVLRRRAAEDWVARRAAHHILRDIVNERLRGKQ